MLRKRRIIIFIIVSLINVGLLALLWSQLVTPASHSAGVTPPQGSSQLNLNDPMVNKAAPDFTLKTLSSQSSSSIHLASYKGQPVVLNVWASWCDPCKREASLLEDAWQKNRSQGVAFIGIDFQDAQSDGLSFLQQYGITYPNVIDSDGSVTISFGVTATPETVFINRNGIVVAAVRGMLTEQTLNSGIQLCLK